MTLHARIQFPDQTPRPRTSGARYWLTLPQEGEGHNATTKVLARTETYHPRIRLKGSYPNITDLEFTGEADRKETLTVAAATLLIALDGYDAKRPISAYGEEPNPAGIEFYRELGFTEARHQPPIEMVGDRSMQYVHLTAKNVESVRAAITSTYSFAISEPTSE